jgi:DNA topoisomerase I
MSQILRRLDDTRAYVDEKGAQVRDPAVLEYLRRLVIPPNYHGVQIFYDPTTQPKILYQGYDSKNRLQRIYGDKWATHRKHKKFCDLIQFCQQFAKMTQTIDELIAAATITKGKCIAMVLKLIMMCYFRIGNRKYKELYGSFGAMTILKEHVSLRDSPQGQSLFISFPGKKGVVNTCDVRDAKFIAEMKSFMVTPGKELFTYPKDGKLTPLKAIDVNKWLAKFDSLITSKDFRTYDANILLLDELKKYGGDSTVNARKKHAIKSILAVSTKLHNTPAILKKEYANMGILDMFVESAEQFTQTFSNIEDTHSSFCKHLTRLCQ